MSKLSIDQIDHIAKLSKLELSEKEKELYAGQLSSVLDYVSELQEINTDNIEEATNITGLSNVWREDKIEKSDIGYDDIAKNAPEFKDGNFVVPGVFE